MGSEINERLCDWIHLDEMVEWSKAICMSNDRIDNILHT